MASAGKVLRHFRHHGEKSNCFLCLLNFFKLVYISPSLYAIWVEQHAPYYISKTRLAKKESILSEIKSILDHLGPFTLFFQ